MYSTKRVWVQEGRKLRGVDILSLIERLPEQDDVLQEAMEKDILSDPEEFSMATEALNVSDFDSENELMTFAGETQKLIKKSTQFSFSKMNNSFASLVFARG